MNPIDVTVGFVIGVIVSAIFTGIMVSIFKRDNGELPQSYIKTALMVMGALLVTTMLLPNGTASAQTPAPIPTLDIPISELFTQTNFWMATFSPVTAIGVGLTIALAVLGYVGLMIANAFKR